MNEMIINNLTVTTMQVNVQFLQQLQPEWSRFVTIVKQQHKLDEVSYHKLFDILKQYQNEVNELHAEKLARNANPLALVATAQARQDPFYQSSRHKGKEIAKPITPPFETASKEDNDLEQAQRDKDMKKNLALIVKYFKKIYKPTNNNLRTSSNSKNKNLDTTPWFKNDNHSRQFGTQRIVNVAAARKNVGSKVVHQSGIQCFNCREFGHFLKECRKLKRVKDSAYHKEKMLLCKQAEQGVPLQAEQYDWLADTDEEVDEQELEAHYSYMAKIQEVPTADSGTDSESVEQVQNDVGYNVFTNHLQHYEQSQYNEQNDVKSNDERVALANLNASLKLDVDENKKIQKQLKKVNTTLAQELKECKAILAETSKSLGESISVLDSCLVVLQTKLAEFEKFKAFNDRTVDYDKIKRKLNDAPGQLAHKDTVIREGLKTKAYELSVVKEKHNGLMKHSLLTKSHYEGLVKQKTKVIMDLKLREEHDIEKMLSMEKQLKFLKEIVYKRSQSIQTIHMMAPKVPTYNVRPTFANPRYLKQAQSEIPCLYAFPYDQNTHANRLIPDGEETLALERESRSKLNKDSVRPYDHTKLNSLYEIDELESDKVEFSDMYDVILQECVRLAQKISKQTESVSKKVHTELLQRFAKVEKYSISFEIALQNFKEQNIAISELKKLIEKGKEKYVDTKFDRPSVVRQPNAQRIRKPSVLGKPTPFSNSLERKYFPKTKSVPKANVSKGLSKQVTAQTLPQTTMKAVSNTNVLKLGMYRIDNRTTHTKASHLPQTIRNTNPRVSTSTGVNHKPTVSRPQLKSNQSRDKVLPNNSQVKVKKTQVEVHPRIPSVSNKMKSVTTCKVSLNSRTLNANVVCATCNKCLVDSSHFACVTKMLNEVHARTKKPTVIVQLILFIVNFGCTKHMTGNLKLLYNFVEKFLGTIRFGNDQFAPILGFGDFIQRNVTINRVYYVEGLNHNLFSVGQFCDADLEVAFKKCTCFVRDLEGNDLLSGNHGSDLYTISLQESTSSTPLCLMAKAIPTQAWL
nr:integrase, catalytic region, zinc finger, CCHC-type, peptidase aspartic, catalytic [Tanacetum cinerariifolium]